MWDKLTKENVLFSLVDFQESFFSILSKQHVDEVRKNILLVVKMFNKMGIPMIGTDHYRKGLKLTDKSVLEEWSGPEFKDKITFSCLGCEDYLEDLKQNYRPVVIVAGLETQICVLQTVLDLLKREYTVVVLNDACLSTSRLKWENGLELMKDAGAHILNTETLLFYLLKKAQGDDFKYLVKLLKENQ